MLRNTARLLLLTNSTRVRVTTFVTPNQMRCERKKYKRDTHHESRRQPACDPTFTRCHARGKHPRGSDRFVRTCAVALGGIRNGSDTTGAVHGFRVRVRDTPESSFILSGTGHPERSTAARSHGLGHGFDGAGTGAFAVREALRC